MISRRLLIPLFASAFAGVARGEPALAISSADLVQVAVDLRRMAVQPLPPGSDETPASPYCGDKPQWCSLTHVRDLRHPRVIGALMAFVNSYAEGWYEPWYGTPISRVQIYFWKEQHRVGTFGSGEKFFSRGGFPDDKIIHASDEQIEEFYKLAHIK